MSGGAFFDTSVPLYLLDTNLPENDPTSRWITSTLYVSDRTMRLMQYAVLAIGGVRALRALGVEPSVFHLNEGHASLAALELLRAERADGLGHAAAIESVRSRVVFTTHTPVAAGNEHYSADEVANVFGRLADHVGIDDVDGHSGIAGEVPGFLVAFDDVDDDVFAVGGHPCLRQLRRTVGHQGGDEARAWPAQQVDQAVGQECGHTDLRFS